MDRFFNEVAVDQRERIPGLPHVVKPVVLAYPVPKQLPNDFQAALMGISAETACISLSKPDSSHGNHLAGVQAYFGITPLAIASARFESKHHCRRGGRNVLCTLGLQALCAETGRALLQLEAQHHLGGELYGCTPVRQFLLSIFSFTEYEWCTPDQELYCMAILVRTDGRHHDAGRPILRFIIYTKEGRIMATTDDIVGTFKAPRIN